MPAFNNISLTTILYIFASMGCTVGANILLKQGAMRPGYFETWPLSLINMNTFFGGIFFLSAFIFYLMVLKKMPLNLAQSIFSIQFVLVILAASIFLKESISLQRWIGILLITIGIITVAYSTGSNINQKP